MVGSFPVDFVDRKNGFEKKSGRNASVASRRRRIQAAHPFDATTPVGG